MEFSCRICGNTYENRPHTIREMGLGTFEEFEYAECARCGTIQIVEIPDLAKYYPRDYYAFADGQDSYFTSKIRRRIAARLVGSYLMGGWNPLGKHLAEKKELGFVGFFPMPLADRELGLDRRTKILDFGCGNGKLLKYLFYYGFRDLTGADAFIDGDIIYPNGIRIYKRTLDDFESQFDLVMLHHSFEHIPDPRAALRGIRRLLPAGRFALIRIPIVNYAWEKYGVNWFQLDAPRHLYSYTERAFRSMAEDEGFAVTKVEYDSEVFQFSVSEQYAKGIWMHDERSFQGDFTKAIFTREQFDEWKREAERLNREGRGDQACFFLRALA